MTLCCPPSSPHTQPGRLGSASDKELAVLLANPLLFLLCHQFPTSPLWGPNLSPQPLTLAWTIQTAQEKASEISTKLLL